MTFFGVGQFLSNPLCDDGGMNNRKQQFLTAVQILAPNDSFIIQTAQRVSEASLPAFPGGAALEFVATLETLKPAALPVNSPRPSKPQARDRDDSEPGLAGSESPSEAVETNAAAAHPGEMVLKDAVRVRSAVFWLRLGEADLALKELEGLSRMAWNHPAAAETRETAVGLLGETSAVLVRE